MDKPVFETVESLRAHPGTVFDLQDHLRRAFEDFCNTYHKEVPYKDAFMGVHNFHKLIILDIARRAGMTGDARAMFLKLSSDTYMQAMIEAAKKD